MILPKLYSTEAKEAEAVAFIQWMAESGGKIKVGFSGGKDSVVLKELVRRAGIDCSIQYSATQIDPPEVVQFIKQHHPDVEFRYPKHKFFAKILTKNPPLPGYRWCCSVLKHEAGADEGVNAILLGVRAEESSKRKKYQRITQDRGRGVDLVYPILNWTEVDIWDYIELRQLPYCELYDDFDRLGCVLCVYKSERAHELARQNGRDYTKPSRIP